MIWRMVKGRRRAVKLNCAIDGICFHLCRRSLGAFHLRIFFRCAVADSEHPVQPQTVLSVRVCDIVLRKVRQGLLIEPDIESAIGYAHRFL